MDIRIAAVVLRNWQGEILSVRKRGTSSFMLVGGKLDPGESALSAAVREVAEELRLDLDPVQLHHLGRFHAPAANEAEMGVDCDVFLAPEPLGGNCRRSSRKSRRHASSRWIHGTRCWPH
ncbi:NUDIX domain protein [Corynebacterium occultum]|uniref:NUDIX domain protein n=1 Tax=Corynebacterium occultum TaxID=2675219 RepID=A0A6B8WKM3_9CORY|nr:NUDIX domain-containing protein [Corynebacterium occultum]QGU06978.1 NUDIX domain protein [Corynebacterium occultum]